MPHVQPMRSRLDRFPACKEVDSAVEARQYNLVRLALARMGSPLRISVAAVGGLDLYVDRDVWILADSAINDRPVLAWLDFASHRDNLNQPVPCRLRHYNDHAGPIARSLLHELERLLPGELAAAQAAAPTVTPLR